ncbi:MAG: Bug family tripartite tricarboxylate transporter substrate binding protein [Thermodesulfobacteriota bacterium]
MENLKGLRGRKGCAIILALAFCLCIWMASTEAAEKFPAKAVRVIVPQSAGGSIDMEPRGFTPYLSKTLGVDIILENLPGAGGKMGLTKVWKADPNGYTLLYHGIPQSIMNEYLFKTEFKTSGFTHVFGLCITNMVLLVHPDNWKTFDEFLKVAREKTLSGGVPSPGSTSHICGLATVDKLGMKANWVPFDGSGEVLSSLAGKHIDFAIISTNSAQPLVAAGKIRPLLVYSDAPDSVFPDVPFPSKLGHNMTVMAAVRGFVAPPNTPPDRVKILEDAMLKTARSPAFLEWAKNRKIDITPLDGKKYLGETQKQYVLLDQFRNLFKSQ